MTYIKPPDEESQKQDDGCIFCLKSSEQRDEDNLLLYRSEHCFVLMNLYPYNNGHLLVAPRAHKATLEELTPDELLDSVEAVRLCVRALGELMTPDGYNVGLNLGRAAGAGLPGHLHWHVVPRWNGDTNFMPVLADVRVIVQSLEALYDLLAPRLRSG